MDVKEETKDLCILAFARAINASQRGRLIGVLMSARGGEDSESFEEGARDASSGEYTFETICARREEWSGKDFDELIELLQKRLSRL